MNVYLVPYFDMLTVLFIVLAIIQLFKIKLQKDFKSTFILFLFAFVLFGIVHIFNVLEHLYITQIFDPFEDYVEILIPPVLLFSFYSYYLNLQLKKNKETEAELKLTLEKSEESNKLKSSFLANMSHEIRTPMNAILGFTELILNEKLNEPKRKQFGDIIDINSKLLLSLINDIIDISKIESGQLKIANENFELKKELEEIFKLFENQAKMKSLDFKLNIDSQLEDQVVFSDPFRIRQIFTNLISNALKFTSAGGIEIGALLKYPYIEFYVHDTGEGIADEEKEMIFERFMQSKRQDLQKVQKGTGLGLAISKALTIMLGGEISIDSRLNEGSRFSFTIPHDKLNAISKEKFEDKLDERDVKIKGRTILIAEDEDSNYIFFEEIFDASENKLIRTFTGNETVLQVKLNSNIDLILMDIQMPGFDGLKTTKEIRNFNQDVPIIAQTAYAMVGDKESALNAGCTDYIAKPFKKSEIISLVKKYLS